MLPGLGISAPPLPVVLHDDLREHVSEGMRLNGSVKASHAHSLASLLDSSRSELPLCLWPILGSLANSKHTLEMDTAHPPAVWGGSLLAHHFGLISVA